MKAPNERNKKKTEKGVKGLPLKEAKYESAQCPAVQNNRQNKASLIYLGPQVACHLFWLKHCPQKI